MSTNRDAIGGWWAGNPMTYADVHGTTGFGEASYELGSKEFFDEVDRRFFERHRFAHAQYPIFSGFFDYEKFREKRVLEIGCGMGTLLRTWARQGAKITGIDLTHTATDVTKKSLAVCGLQANVVQTDGQRLPFPDSTFDLVYSWGVIHHIPDMTRSVEEIYRVLKPGGEVAIMVYAKRSLYFYWMCRLVEGIIHLERSFLDDVGLSSRYYDGALEEGSPLARVLTANDMSELLRRFTNVKVQVCGPLQWIYMQILPFVWMYLPKSYYDYWSRKIGSFLWVTGSKAEYQE